MSMIKKALDSKRKNKKLTKVTESFKGATSSFFGDLTKAAKKSIAERRRKFGNKD